MSVRQQIGDFATVTLSWSFPLPMRKTAVSCGAVMCDRSDPGGKFLL
jgi:hypothetical protein